jgi:uncharacterized protein (DUF2141 family)
MRSILLIAIFLLPSSWLSLLSQPSQGNLRIEVRGARSNKGVVLCSVFKDAKGYPDQPSLAIYKSRLPLKEGQVYFEVSALPVGYYAVALLHDENEDNKMNTSALGLPKEGYGFSNNVMGLFGPPSFSKAAVLVKEGAKTVVPMALRY